MKKFLFTLIIITISFGQLQTIDATNIEKLKSLEGKFISVKGKVINTAYSKTGKVQYLNFSEDFTKNFSVVIFSRHLKNFKKKEIDPHTFYLNKTIVVSGKLKIYKNMPEIIVAFPMQIKIIEEEE